MTPEYQKQAIITDVHSPPNFRTDITCANIDEFYLLDKKYKKFHLDKHERINLW
jgi:predicted metalloendopeptidase